MPYLQPASELLVLKGGKISARDIHPQFYPPPFSLTQNSENIHLIINQWMNHTSHINKPTNIVQVQSIIIHAKGQMLISTDLGGYYRIVTIWFPGYRRRCVLAYPPSNRPTDRNGSSSKQNMSVLIKNNLKSTTIHYKIRVWLWYIYKTPNFSLLYIYRRGQHFEVDCVSPISIGLHLNLTSTVKLK